MKRPARIAIIVVVAGAAAGPLVGRLYDVWARTRYQNVNFEPVSHLAVSDFLHAFAEPTPPGRLPGDPLARLGMTAAETKAPADAVVRFVGATRYLNDAHAVVTHSIDDATRDLGTCLDALDRHDVKATVFLNTDFGDLEGIWPRLRQAAANGHEIGSHSRRHQCQRPETALFCFRAFADWEVMGSREDILREIGQPYVWSFAYPCGDCADFAFVQKKLARSGYLYARAYPEAQNQHEDPDLRTWDPHPMRALYTQVVQMNLGVPGTGRTDVPTVNARFDDVYKEGGIYHFVSHPRWLDFGPSGFYEQHLAHIARRSDVWYVPTGPLYAYETAREHVRVEPIASQAGRERFAVVTDLDPTIYGVSVTLEFRAPAGYGVWRAGRALQPHQGLTAGWSEESVRRDGERMFVTAPAGAVLEFSPSSGSVESWSRVHE